MAEPKHDAMAAPEPPHPPMHEPMHPKPMPMMAWGKFFAMIAASTLVMFVLMYLNTFVIDHATFSQTRMWMAVVMGSAMALIMLRFMWAMYKGEATRLAVVGGSVLAFAAALFLVRSQQTVDDVSFMKAMIPHHSIAIMTSRRAQISDPRTRELADAIIAAQVKEIAQMKLLIADIEANGRRGDAMLPAREAVMTPKMEEEARAAVQ